MTGNDHSFFPSLREQINLESLFKFNTGLMLNNSRLEILAPALISHDLRRLPQGVFEQLVTLPTEVRFDLGQTRVLLCWTGTNEKDKYKRD